MHKPQARRHSAQGDSRVLDSDRARTDVRETLLEPQERSDPQSLNFSVTEELQWE